MSGRLDHASAVATVAPLSGCPRGLLDASVEFRPHGYPGYALDDPDTRLGEIALLLRALMGRYDMKYSDGFEIRSSPSKNQPTRGLRPWCWPPGLYLWGMRTTEWLARIVRWAWEGVGWPSGVSTTLEDDTSPSLNQTPRLLHGVPPLHRQLHGPPRPGHHPYICVPPPPCQRAPERQPQPGAARSTVLDVAVLGPGPPFRMLQPWSRVHRLLGLGMPSWMLQLWGPPFRMLQPRGQVHRPEYCSSEAGFTVLAVSMVAFLLHKVGELFLFLLIN